MNLKRVRKIPVTMTFFLILLVFTVMLLTMTIVGAIVYFLFKHGIITEITEPTIIPPLIVMAIMSTAIATAITGLMSRIPLNPLRKVIRAINKLAEGDFSVRLDLKSTNELTELSKSFNRMAEELGSIETLRTDFVNNFSHEFKTPIVSLRGFAKILRNADLTQEERNEYLDIIISESGRLASLSKNVLTLCRIENLAMLTESTEFDLTEQIRRVALVLEPKWSAKELALIVDLDEVSFKGNAELLNQVWFNLIDNAIKFSPNKSKIKIKLRQKDGFAIFKIMDSGPGVDEETAKHIFDRFYQGDLSHTTEGNGIGLAIVQKTARLYGGTVSVESELGIGAAFTVSLPGALPVTLPPLVPSLNE